MSITEHEKEKLRFEIMKELKDDFDKFDYDSYIDSRLTYSENKDAIYDKIDSVRDKKVTTKDIKENKARYGYEKESKEKKEDNPVTNYFKGFVRYDKPSESIMFRKPTVEEKSHFISNPKSSLIQIGKPVTDKTYSFFKSSNKIGNYLKPSSRVRYSTIGSKMSATMRESQQKQNIFRR